MTRETRRRLLLHAHAAANRFCKRAEDTPYFVPATDAFVAGWLLGYRAHKRDIRAKIGKNVLYGDLESPRAATAFKRVIGPPIAPLQPVGIQCDDWHRGPPIAPLQPVGIQCDDWHREANTRCNLPVGHGGHHRCEIDANNWSEWW